MKTTISQLLEQKFREAFTSLGFTASSPIVLQESSKPEFGDYQVNGVMALSKKLKINGRELAGQIIERVVTDDVISKLEVAGPGFINITLSREYLSQVLNKELLSASVDHQRKIVVDYSSPNLAKEMHVGHLRSTIIGDALVRLYEHLGHKVIRRNHVGDWGTQFGMLTAYLIDINQGDVDMGMVLHDLEDFYRKAKIRFDEDQVFADRAREYVVKLQSGDIKILALWKQFVAISLSHCQEIYDRLHVKLTPKDAVGESSYNELLSVVIQNLVDKGIAVDSDGAKCVFFAEGELDASDETPFIIQKKDGAYLYATTDIAAVYDRVQNLHADQLVYVIDARQSLHMKQLFATVKKSGMVGSETIMQHVAFGTMLGEDNRPFKTRSGDTIKLITLMQDAVRRATEIVRTRNPEWSEAEVNKLAEVLGIASMKYADLAKNRICDYIFSFDKMLSFEGNTAPYMLYAYVRINSIFKKGNLNITDYLDRKIVVTEMEEHCLAVHLIRFCDRMLQAATENYPHYICGYIYDLAVLFMRFYERCPIMKAANLEQQDSRLALAALTAEILRTSLNLLGIEVVEQM